MTDYEYELEELTAWYAAELAKLSAKQAAEQSVLDYEMAMKKIAIIRKYKEIENDREKI